MWGKLNPAYGKKCWKLNPPNGQNNSSGKIICSGFCCERTHLLNNFKNLIHKTVKNISSGVGHLQHDGASMVSKHDPHFKKQIKETTYALLSLAAGDISKWYAHARHKLMIWTKENQTRLIYFSMMISRQNQKNTLCDFHRRVPPLRATHHTSAHGDTPFSRDGLRLTQVIM